MTSRKLTFVVALATFISVSSVAAAAAEFGPWSQAARVESIPGTAADFNGPELDGCPFISSDGLMFFMASDRPGGRGGIDIWLSTREDTDDPWGSPVNVGEPVNTEHNDFCPTLAADGHRFFFVSNRPGFCGGDDIFTARFSRGEGFQAVSNIGCDVNSSANEASPFPLRIPRLGEHLYFSSARAGGFDLTDAALPSGDSDIYQAERQAGSFGNVTLVPGVNTAAADGHPNLRRDGLEIFFFSNRTGALGNDIYSAVRGSVTDSWSVPENLGSLVNSDAAETRPSISWDGTTLYFGSTRVGGEGSTDHYYVTRERLGG